MKKFIPVLGVLCFFSCNGYLIIPSSVEETPTEVDNQQEGVDGVDSGAYRIFVSSQTFTGDLGGLSGADQKCQDLANAAGLTLTYKAILSSSDTHAKDRISNTPGKVYLVRGENDKVEVALSVNDLFNTSTTHLLAAIDLTENYTNVSGEDVYTGTAINGTSYGSGGGFGADPDGLCSDWSNGTNLGSDSYANGITNSVDGNFLLQARSLSSCDEQRRIYCISQ